MQEIEVSLSQNSQDIGVDTLQSTTQNIGVEIAGESTGIEVLHDDTLKGKGQRSAPLGIADSVLENIDSKVSDVKVNNESVVENTVANINVGTATITIQKNNQDIDSFTLQDTSNKSINISVPTKTSDINNDSDYQTGTEVDNAISTHNTSNDAHSNLLSPMSQSIANNNDAISAETLRATGIEDGLQNQITANSNNITTINGKIPEQASSSNQLADKNFVNSSVATNTANFIGTFNSVADLEAYSGTLTNNDYAFVISTDSAGNTVYNRYKYTTATTPASWVFEYALNNSSFTAAQWAAINSGATTTNITQIGTNTTAIGNHIADKANPHQVTAAQVGLGNVNNTSDLDKPISNATQNALNAKANTADLGTAAYTASTDYATAAQGTKADTAVQPGDLATVATTGLYSDLTGTPNLATVATSGSYTDLSNTPTIPTVNNSTITITQGGVTKGSFTLNQASGDIIDLDAGGSDFDELTPSEVETLWNNAATYTLSLTPKYLDVYSGYYVTEFTVKDQNDNVLFQSDGSMGTQSITFNALSSSIVISNLIRGNPATTGLGVFECTVTGCTATKHASSYSGYYDYITLSNFTSNNPTIELVWGYGPVGPGPLPK